MKKCLSSLALAVVLFACRQDADEAAPKPNPIDCRDNCLFAVQDAPGTIVQMACFNRFGILTDDPNTPQRDTIFGIPDWLSSEFATVGQQVVFSGTFRENTLTPQFPDPSISLDDLYQMKVLGMKAGN